MHLRFWPGQRMFAPFGMAERLVLVAMLVVALTLRWDVRDHFTHVDDISVATRIIDARAHFAPAHMSAVIARGSGHYPRLTTALQAVHRSPLAIPLAHLASYVAVAIQVPSTTTYAPLQFFATTLALGEGTSYKDTLLRGRLPSLIASMLIIAVMLCLGLRLFPANTSSVAVVMATVVATSAELAVYAKQMENYALGALAMACLLLLLTYVVDDDDVVTWRKAITGGAIVALLGHAQYQLLFAAPAFYAAWWLSSYAIRRNWTSLFRIVASGFVSGLLVMPEYILFLRKWSHAGIDWNGGPSGEFVFAPEAGASAFFAGLFTYFPRNGYLSLEATVSPVAGWHPLFRIIGLFLGTLAIGGFLALVRSKVHRERAVGWFVASLAIIWIALVVTQRVTLSPTRHALVLLPVWATCVGAGVKAVVDRVKAGQRTIPLMFACLLALLALTSLPRTRSERRDRLSEDAMVAFIEAQHVTTIFAYEWSGNLSLMPSVLSKASVFEQQNANLDARWVNSPPRSLDRIAFFSVRAPFTPARFDSLRTALNADSLSKQAGLLMPPLSEYDTVASRVERSDVQVDVSRRTRNGTNELFLYVLQRKPESVVVAKRTL